MIDAGPPPLILERPAIIRPAGELWTPASFLPGMFGGMLPEGGNDTFTQLLLHCDGADTSTTFTDVSAAARAVTVHGNAQVDTAQSVFGGGSLLLDGTGDDLIVTSITTFGSGPWSFDCRFRPNSVTGFQVIAACVQAGGFGFIIARNGTALEFYISSNGSSFNVANAVSGGTVAIGTWYYLQCEFSGSAYTVRLNGAQIINVVSATALFGSLANGFAIGSQGGIGSYWNGWIDEVRLSIGTTRPTATPDVAYS